MFVLVAHFRLAEAQGGSVPEDARAPLAMLAASPECQRLLFAHSTESSERFVLMAEFESAATYRRSLSPWPMRTTVVPWLSTADVQSSEVSEVLWGAVAGAVTEYEPTVPEPGR